MSQVVFVCSHVECEIDQNCPFWILLENCEKRNVTIKCETLHLIDEHFAAYSHSPEFKMRENGDSIDCLNKRVRLLMMESGMETQMGLRKCDTRS